MIYGGGGGLPLPLPLLFLAPFSRCNFLLPNPTETLATQANWWIMERICSLSTSKDSQLLCVQRSLATKKSSSILTNVQTWVYNRFEFIEVYCRRLVEISKAFVAGGKEPKSLLLFLLLRNARFNLTWKTSFYD